MKQLQNNIKSIWINVSAKCIS